MKPAPIIDRDREWAALERTWELAASGIPQLVVVYGRRRVGKTFLLSHLTANRRSVFFAATQQSERIELERFSEAVHAGLGERALDVAGGRVVSWEAALRYLAAMATHEPLLAVIDEATYLTGSSAGFASIVQAVWDHVTADCRLMLVLTGSAVGVVEHMLGADGPLRGRPTSKLRLEPVALSDAHAFLPNLEPAALVRAYAVCGGFPMHLRAWDETRSFDRNLLTLAGTSGGVLLDDAVAIVREETSSAGGYNRILGAIGRGRHQISAIASDAAQRIEYPMNVLLSAGIVRRLVPLGVSKGARPIYDLADPYLRFWYSVLYANVALIEGGQGRQVLADRVGEIDRHVAVVFEDACREHCRRLIDSGELPHAVVGRWWTHSGESCEIDVLGLAAGRSVIVGEAKWHKRPAGVHELLALRRKLTCAPRPVDDAQLVIWSRSGVDQAVLDAGVRSYGPEDVLRG